MARRLIVNCRCPLCGGQVEAVPDGILKQNPHYHNAEMVVTRTGIKQYIHSLLRNKNDIIFLRGSLFHSQTPSFYQTF